VARTKITLGNKESGEGAQARSHLFSFGGMTGNQGAPPCAAKGTGTAGERILKIDQYLAKL